MKKLLLSISIITMIVSCSSDEKTNDTSVANDIGYFNVTLNGETITYEFREEDFTFATYPESCKPNIELAKQFVGQAEKLKYFLDIYLVHNDNKSQFQGYDIKSTSAKTDFTTISNCFNNFDLITDYEDKLENKYLYLNASSTNFNKIESVTVYKENANDITYAVKGNFEVTFKKADNTLIPVKGSYKTFIYLYK